MKNVLVLCTGNSCRSQIADGYLTYFAKNNATIYSAGIETHGVNSRAIAIMKLDGIDISQNTSNNVSEYMDIDFDFISQFAITHTKIARIFLVKMPNEFTKTFLIHRK